MSKIAELFNQKLAVINIGTEMFKDEIEKQNVNVVQVEWKPPAGGNIELINALDSLEPLQEKIEAANKKAFERLSTAQPVLIDIQSAEDFIPGMTKNTILHSGPPLSWDEMPGPMCGAILGALIYEGLARDTEEAEKLVSTGEITFIPCHEQGGVGPMAGVISASMPLFIVENTTHGNKAFSNFNEGLGKVLRFGACSEEVIDRLRWIEKVLAPALKKAVSQSGGIDLKVILTQAIHMGDEGHNRNKAGTSLFIRAIVPSLIKAGIPSKEILDILGFINSNEHFFLNLSMAFCKAVLDAASNIPYSTLVTVMTRNGKEFGIRISGLGEEWFTGQAQMVKGLLFPGFSEEEANPDIGDSAITETAGIGGFAMAAAPAIVQFVGGSAENALAISEKMYGITIGENKYFTIPQLDFRGTPTGIDLRKVVESGVLPEINTGIAHKKAGIGQVGAGLVNPPHECFYKALLAFTRKYVLRRPLN